ncbi:MAG: NADH-quinone oxidoreductase subunit NuoB [Planctomycetaceae bacterium]|nr:NADH-quinone oxidoreductase subunit NuoB [Planctomycetales bacterium]MCB9874520.1 NADH-quinone oxidoreductase subunit NuoB [Planctomycetaceae bacterium]MCB9940863.1 NADH-quinone oxidoreductase subunit NuoB [Planctomycetaceae bacterium]HRX82202.1 NADH-quinone oxidoreductase subunit NuoB [Pirellulaceae bacterium]
MLNIINERIKQGYRTIPFPDGEMPKLPERYRGLPVIDSKKCPEGCAKCVDACPTDAITMDGDMKIDLGRCLFCTDCMDACPEGAIEYTQDFRLATRTREGLVTDGRAFELAHSIDEKSRKIFGRSLQLRQVSAGGCNACEADINVLGTLVFDLGRFGVKIVASPRHADGLIVTGPVTQNMKLALEKTYAATPSPKFVIAVGACAISGGPFVDHDEQNNGVDSILSVDLYIPGCPPHPLTILDGILRLLGRIETNAG